MDRHRVRWMCRTAAVLVAGGLVLTGCASGSERKDSAAKDAAAKGEATRFVACLTSHGLDAKIGAENDLVFVATVDAGTTTGAGGSGATGGQALMFEYGKDGRFWAAAKDSRYFAQDPDTQHTYAACESQHPRFHQPEVAVGNAPAVQAEPQENQQKVDLAFARCARDAGFAWVADPSPATGGGIKLPLDLKEDEFRALLKACYKKNTPWIGWRFDGQLSFDYVAVLQEFTGAPAGQVFTAGPVGGVDGSGPTPDGDK